MQKKNHSNHDIGDQIGIAREIFLILDDALFRNRFCLLSHVYKKTAFLYFNCFNNFFRIIINLIVVTITSSITVLKREREGISQSQFVFPSCLSEPNGHWPLQAAWKDKLGLRYALSFSLQYSNAGCDCYYN